MSGEAFIILLFLNGVLVMEPEVPVYTAEQCRVRQNELLREGAADLVTCQPVTVEP